MGGLAKTEALEGIPNRMNNTLRSLTNSYVNSPGAVVPGDSGTVFRNTTNKSWWYAGNTYRMIPET